MKSVATREQSGGRRKEGLGGVYLAQPLVDVVEVPTLHSRPAESLYSLHGWYCYKAAYAYPRASAPMGFHSVTPL